MAPAPAVELSFSSADVIAGMGTLGLDDALEKVGDAILDMDVITKSTLLILLASAGVSIRNKALLLKSLGNPPLPEVCYCIQCSCSDSLVVYCTVV